MIRYLENNEKNRIKDLYKKCFPEDTPEYIDYYFENRLPNNAIAVSEENGEIEGMVHLIPKNVILDKLKTNIMYIYGVGTEEGMRNKGIMSKIMSKVIIDMFEDMEAFTYLIPENEDTANMYRKLGFEFVMDKHNLREKEQRKKAMHTLISRKADNSDLVRLSIFAQLSMEKDYSISLVKDIEYFKKMKELVEVEGGYIEIFIENKVIIGYRIWVDNDILEEVLDETSQTLSWLDNEGKPYVMARLLNVRKTLRLLGFKGLGCTTIEISDPIIKENNGVFKLSYHHGNVRLDKIEDDCEMIEHHLTIGELTAHVFGYKIIDGLPKICKDNSFYINDYL